MEPAVRGARTQSGIATAPDSRIPDCGSAKPRLRALKAKPPGTEFLDAETGRQNSRQIALAPGETKIREMSGRKSPQKRPIWRRVGNARFAETGWWRRSGPNCLLPTQGSNQSPNLGPGTEFFAAETGRRNGLIRLDCRSRDCANQRLRQTCL